MPDRVALITGASSGIGFATALALARAGGQIVMHGRDAARLARAAGQVRSATGNEMVTTLVADFLSQAEIRRAAEQFKGAHERLDVLVNNAGAIFANRQVTVDGYERTWALNHLGYVLLTLSLLGPLRAAHAARVVNVASGAHREARLEFDNLQAERHFAPMDAYRRSKLGNVLFTYALARHLAGGGITVNCLHPGVVRTRFGNDLPGLFGLGVKLARPFFISAGKGAKTTVFLASSPEVAGKSGGYYSGCRAVRSSPLSYDDAVCERLWRISLQETGCETVLS